MRKRGASARHRLVPEANTATPTQPKIATASAFKYLQEMGTGMHRIVRNEFATNLRGVAIPTMVPCDYCANYNQQPWKPLRYQTRPDHNQKWCEVLWNGSARSTNALFLWPLRIQHLHHSKYAHSY